MTREAEVELKLLQQVERLKRQAEERSRTLQRAAPSASAAETRVLEAMTGARWNFQTFARGLQQ